MEVATNTLIKSDYLRVLLEHTDSSMNEVFIDEDPTIFRHILNLLRDPQYPFPAELTYKCDYYQITPTQLFGNSDNSSLPVDFFDSSCYEVEQVDKDQIYPYGSDAGTAASVLKLVATGAQDTTILSSPWGAYDTTSSGGYTSAIIPQGPMCKISSSKSMDIMTNIYLKQKFKFKEATLNLTFEDLYRSIELVVGGQVIARLTGKILDIVAPFACFRHVLKVSKDQHVWEVQLELPICYFFKTNDHFVAGLKTCDPQGLPVAAMSASVEVRLDHQRRGLNKGGTMVLGYLLGDVAQRQQLQNLQEERNIWQYYIDEKYVSCKSYAKLIHTKSNGMRLNFNHLIPELYVSVQNHDGINVRLQKIVLSLNNMEDTYDAITLDCRQGIYRLAFKGKPINFSRIDTVILYVYPVVPDDQQKCKLDITCVAVNFNRCKHMSQLFGIMFTG